MAAPGFSETYGYDTLSRPTSTVTTIGGKSYTTTLSYHNSGSAIGQLRRIEYPTSTSGSTLLADYDYDSDGILYRVKDGDAPSTVWYELKETDALGQPRHGRFGNGLDQYLDYDDATHRLASIKSGPGTTPSLQNLRYEWDKLGNLEFRHDDRQGLTEAFYYDDLNRLDEVFLGSTSTLSLTYSLSGNVSYKSDVGTYTYSTHSKAVDQITGLRPATYLYDANGNRTRHNGDDVTWFSYNLPNRIDYGTDYAEFDYGPDRQRTKQVARTGSSTITTYYAGPHFEEESNGTATTFRHHILFGGQTVALVEKPTAGGTRTHYVHRDHLSAVDALTDGAQLVSQRLSFDAFGKRRNTDWTADTADIRFTDSHTTERGYTGHEHLDNVRMVHMNGRVLDPIIGRVISADPTVPDPYNGQAFNRMSYVYNNPLSFIDPSGFEGIESAPVPALSSDNSVVRRFLMKLGFNDNKYERTDILAHSLQTPARGTEATCPGSCHSGGITAPIITPELLDYSRDFYTNLLEESMFVFGAYHASTGEYFFSGNEASRFWGAVAITPLGLVRVGARAVKAPSAGARFLGRTDGQVLDTAAIRIPGPRNAAQGKLDYLLGRVASQDSVAKGGFFQGVMGFDDASLATALSQHLTTNFGGAVIQGNRIVVAGQMAGPAGRVANVRSVWQVTEDGFVDLITAHPH